MRPIPSSGEQVPAIRLGTSATFSHAARSEDRAAIREVMRMMVDRGGRIFDTAPSYGASEEVGTGIANDFGIAERPFWATNMIVAGRGANGTADPAAARAQLETSFRRINRPTNDVLQVHTLGDVLTQVAVRVSPTKGHGTDLTRLTLSSQIRA